MKRGAFEVGSGNAEVGKKEIRAFEVGSGNAEVGKKEIRAVEVGSGNAAFGELRRDKVGKMEREYDFGLRRA